jgi:hypothetical protein
MSGLPPLPTMNPAAPAPTAPAAPPAPTPVAAQPVVEAQPITEAVPISDAAPAMEEVLEQSSDQLLRLIHIEDMLKELTGTVSDTREEMQAGFVQAGAAAPKAAAPKSGDANLGPRLDELEVQVGRALRKQGALMLLGVVQLVAVAAGFAWLASRMTAADDEPEIPTITPAAATPAAAPSAEPPAADADDKGPKKKKPSPSRRR